ncbi:MAG TPA: autotransporter-associated beta strand repeat-containing protein, partial [Pirellulales bacterium]
GTVISPFTPTLDITAVLGSASGTGSLVVNNGTSGILQLAAANTFTGGVTLDGGGLYITNAAALGTGIFTINANNTSYTGSVTVANPVVFANGVTSFTYGNYGAGTTTFSGVVSWGTNQDIAITVNAITGATLTSTEQFTGSIFGSGQLIKEGPGELYLSSAANVATLNLSGAGGIQVLGGTLYVNGGGELGFAPAAPVANNIVIDGGVLENNGTTYISPNQGITIGASTGYGTLQAGAALVIDSVISGGAPGAGLISNGASALLLEAGNTYTGPTILGGGGYVEAQNTYALGGSGAGGVTNGSEVGGTVTVLNGTSLFLDTTDTVNVGGAIQIGAQPLVLNGLGYLGSGALRNVSGPDTYGGPITLASNAQIQSDSGFLLLTGNINSTAGAFLQLAGAGNLQITGNIGSGVNNVNKFGSGVAILTGSNSYTGVTSLYSGVIQAQNSAALGASTVQIYSGATLELNGGASNGNLTLTNSMNIAGAGLLSIGIIGVDEPGGAAATPEGAIQSFGGNNTISGAITLSNPAQISSTGSGTLTLSGGISSNNYALTFSGGGTTVISGTGMSLGTSGLNKNDHGMLVLDVANTYSGATNINGGTVLLNVSGALGTSSLATVASGATLALEGGQTYGGGVVRLTLNGNGANAGNTGALDNFSGTNTYSGPITLGSPATISSDAGTLSITSATPISGSGFGLTLAGAGSGTISSSIGTGTGGLTMSGTGTWTLSGANTYTGATTVSSGTLSVTGTNTSAALVANGGILQDNLATNTTGNFTATPTLSLGGGAFNVLGANAGASSETLGGLTLTAGATSSIAVNPNGGSGTTLTLGTTFTRGAAAILDINYTAAGSSGSIVTTGLPTGSGAPTGTNNIFGYMLVTDGTITGLGELNGSSQIVAFNSQTGGTTLIGTSNSASTDFTTYNTVYTSGVLDWSNGGTLGARSVNSLTVDTTNNGGSIFLGADANVLTISSGALVFQGPSNETIYGGQVGASNAELIVDQLGTGTLTIGSAISGGTGSLTLNGGGTLVLTGQSSQIGILNLNGASSTTVGGLSTTGLYVGEAVSGVGIPAGDTIASIGSGSITLAVAATLSSNTTLTFGTANSYSGTTTIYDGVLQAGSNNAFSPNSPVVLTNAAGVGMNLNGYSQSISTLSGGGASGGNINLGSVGIGTVLTVGTGTSPFGGGINENAALGNPYSWNTYSGQISGSGSLALTGGSTLSLTNTANSYTGYTNILSGTVVVNSSLPVNSASELGNSSLPIVVMGSSSSQGAPQGQLVLQGGA